MSGAHRARRAARPVVAGVIGVIGEGAAVGRRAGEDGVDIAVVGFARDSLALLVQDRELPHAVALLGGFERVAQKLVQIGGHDAVLGIVPRALADAIARI